MNQSYGFDQQILRTDAGGMPLDWVDYQDAVRYHHLGQVLYCCGKDLMMIRGGINAVSGQQSTVKVNSIIATVGEAQSKWHHRPGYTPPLNNKTLFKRDDHTCMYCGQGFEHIDLSRDHIKPLSQKGHDIWSNVVTACKRCNNFKAGRTPEQSGMQLLAIPFVPTHAEYVYLRGRRILADQREFLHAHFPRTSPLRERISG